MSPFQNVSFHLLISTVYFHIFVSYFQDTELLLSFVRNLLDRNVTNWKSKSYQDVEVAITMLYSLVESVPVSLLQIFRQF